MSNNFRKILLVITSIILFAVSQRSVSAACCVENCEDSGLCCKTDPCPNPDPGDPPPPGGGACSPSCSLDSVEITDNNTNPPSFTLEFIASTNSCGSRWRNFSIGFDRALVSNNCNLGDVVHNYDYRGQGSVLPFGCIATRLNPADPLNTANLGISLAPNSTYYINLSFGFKKCYGNNPDEPNCDEGICGSITNPFLDNCSINPSSEPMNVGDILTFTTDAYTLEDLVYLNTAPSPTSVTYTGESCSVKRCPEGDDISGYITIRGDNFGTSSGEGYNGDSPRVKVEHNGQVWFDGYVQVNRFGNLVVDSPSLGGESNASQVTLSDVTVWYPAPAQTQFPNNVNNVTYSVNPSPAYLQINSVNPDTSNPYEAVVEALQSTYPGFTYLKSDVYANENLDIAACTETINITVNEDLPDLPWWQVGDSDVSTNDNLISAVPTSQYFNKVVIGSGGYPGVPSFGISANFGSGEVSTTGWQAQSTSTGSRIFDYQYFLNQIPDEISQGYMTNISSGDVSGATPDVNEYEWYKYTGPVDLTLDTPLNLGSRKVILLVENANLQINEDISLTDGSGFFVVIVDKNISIDPSVTSLEGLYVADENISTGSAGAGSDLPLTVRGSMASYTGMNLQRDLTDNSGPAEYFEYAPDQILLFPNTLGVRKISWKEIAP